MTASAGTTFTCSTDDIDLCYLPLDNDDLPTYVMQPRLPVAPPDPGSAP